MSELRIGSLCSGYEGLGMGVQAVLGGRIAWVSDIDPGACKILAHRYPDVPNLGDFTVTDWSTVEPVDVLIALRVKELNSRGPSAPTAPMPTPPIARLVGGVWVTDQADLFSDLGWEPFSQTWPPSGMTRGGMVYALPTSAPRTDAGESSLLPTPTTQDGANTAGPSQFDRSLPLNVLAMALCHCKRGHEFTGENTYWVRPGARACRACRAWQDKVDKARRRGERTPEPPLLPTPACNDMGEGKTVDAWDEWTATMQARHGNGNGNGHGKSLAIEAQRLLPTPTCRDNSDDRVHAGGNPTLVGAALGYKERDVRRMDVVPLPQWGDYAPAIARWEAVLGRPAPAPTEPGPKGSPRLSPRLVEWMMGLPEGWVTDVPGLTRNAQLKALGNGVVPAQCEAALRIILEHVGRAAA